ncbi:NTF2 fold immunity protein [Litorilituus sediminis]|uniref:NTF2 fold domain-containing protein n=1 Tax=Litorilituus sediminis TaxID=718192 RepID=A0A4P6P847_9GAMM|nr:NTF2 fold immunity protein [Litorilituus sediminis]QBG35712.1 hypothetical protein EMK97_08310 [Litorilituus sediminis]
MKFILISILALFISIKATASDISKSKRNKIIYIAETVIKDNYPNSYKKRMEHQYKITDKGSSWRVSWEIRAGVAEGAPVIFISKEDFSVIRHMHYQ